MIERTIRPEEMTALTDLGKDTGRETESNQSSFEDLSSRRPSSRKNFRQKAFVSAGDGLARAESYTESRDHIGNVYMPSHQVGVINLKHI